MVPPWAMDQIDAARGRAWAFSPAAAHPGVGSDRALLRCISSPTASVGPSARRRSRSPPRMNQRSADLERVLGRRPFRPDLDDRISGGATIAGVTIPCQKRDTTLCNVGEPDTGGLTGTCGAMSSQEDLFSKGNKLA